MRKIVRRQSVLGGEPVIAGTRMPVRVLIDFVVANKQVADIQESYPHLTRQQIDDALAYIDRRLHKLRHGATAT